MAPELFPAYWQACSRRADEDGLPAMARNYLDVADALGVAVNEPAGLQRHAAVLARQADAESDTNTAALLAAASRALTSAAQRAVAHGAGRRRDG